VILTYVQELRICNVRLTNGLRRIFDPLAPLAGLALSARYVRPTADGRANGSAGEPRWLRPPAAVEPADGTDGPAGHGSPADPLAATNDPIAESRYMRRAIVAIGVDKTGGLPTLQAAADGATRVAAWAGSQGFDTILLTDKLKPSVTLSEITASIHELVEKRVYDQLVRVFLRPRVAKGLQL
jgi:hypothetical protein